MKAPDLDRTSGLRGQFNADGTVNSARLLPRNAGFGAANGAQDMRSIQIQLRFQF